jgi:dATP pyrophosphohydrolase
MRAEPRAWKRPESVLVVVYTLAGEVLLLERVLPGGYWQSVTGSLHWEEAAQEAAARELAEETGLRGYPLFDCNDINRFSIHPAWRDRYAPDVTENIEHVFTLQLPGHVDITLNAAEHCRYAWLPRDAAMARASSDTNQAAIARHVPARER